MANGHVPTVPSAPFSAWVSAEIARLDAEDMFRDNNQTVVPSRRILADRCRVSQKAIYRYKRSLGDNNQHTDTFERRRVEDMLHYAGVDFADIYPEIAAAEEVELEPDIWCDSCDSTVTPIGGLCPWCKPEPGSPHSCPECFGRKHENARMCIECRRRVGYHRKVAA